MVAILLASMIGTQFQTHGQCLLNRSGLAMAIEPVDTRISNGIQNSRQRERTLGANDAEKIVTFWLDRVSSASLS